MHVSIFDLCSCERSRDGKMMSLSLSGGVHVRHVEMTSSFVQYDVGNLVLMFNSYLRTLLCPISIVRGFLLCRSVY